MFNEFIYLCMAIVTGLLIGMLRSKDRSIYSKHKKIKIIIKWGKKSRLRFKGKNWILYLIDLSVALLKKSG